MKHRHGLRKPLWLRLALLALSVGLLLAAGLGVYYSAPNKDSARKPAASATVTATAKLGAAAQAAGVSPSASPTELERGTGHNVGLQAPTTEIAAVDNCEHRFNVTAFYDRPDAQSVAVVTIQQVMRRGDQWQTEAYSCMAVDLLPDDTFSWKAAGGSGVVFCEVHELTGAAGGTGGIKQLGAWSTEGLYRAAAADWTHLEVLGYDPKLDPSTDTTALRIKADGTFTVG